MRTDFEMYIEYDEHIWNLPCQCPGHCKDYSRTLSEARPRRKPFLRIMPRHTLKEL